MKEKVNTFFIIAIITVVAIFLSSNRKDDKSSVSHVVHGHIKSVDLATGTVEIASSEPDSTIIYDGFETHLSEAEISKAVPTRKIVKIIIHDK